MLRRIRQHWKNYIGNSRMALIGCTILGIWIVLAVAVPAVRTVVIFRAER